MALSGEFQKFPVDNFGLYCSWTAAQSVTGNYSNVTLKVYLKYYNLEVGARTDSTVSINGTSETYTVAAISDYTDGYKLKLLKTKTVKVPCLIKIPYIYSDFIMSIYTWHFFSY